MGFLKEAQITSKLLVKLTKNYTQLDEFNAQSFNFLVRIKCAW